MRDQCKGRSRGKMCHHRSEFNGYCSQHAKNFVKNSGATNSSNNPAFLNTRSRQAVTVMSEFLASNPPTREGLSLHHLPRYLVAKLDRGFDIDTAGLTSDIHEQLTKSYIQGKERIQIIKERNESLRGTAIGRPNLLIPQVAIFIHSAAESTQFYYLVAACAYGTLDYVKSLHRAFRKTKDPLPKMLDMATFHNRPEIVEYCISAGAQVDFRHLYDLNDTNVEGHSDDTFKVLCERVLDTNAPINFFGEILQCAVENDYLDWVRFCLENHVNPDSENNSNKHLILAIAATSASIEISELLIAWGAKIKSSSALTIASHNGRADLVKLLLENGADVNEMGVASIDKDPEDLEGAALHLIEKGRRDVLQILLDYGADVNLKDWNGKTVISRMEENGDEILSSMVSLSTFDNLS